MRIPVCVIVLGTLMGSACGEGRPSVSGLRESFAAQLAANAAASEVSHEGEVITFTGPGAEGGVGPWRIQMDSAVVEPNDDPTYTYKGTVVSSWFSNGQPVQPTGRESNLPIELTSNGLAQDCYALWNSSTATWEWE